MVAKQSGDAKKNYFISAGARAQQAGRQRGGARHCGAPMLRRYATTSAALMRLRANESAVLPPELPQLQGRY